MGGLAYLLYRYFQSPGPLQILTPTCKKGEVLTTESDGTQRCVGMVGAGKHYGLKALPYAGGALVIGITSKTLCGSKASKHKNGSRTRTLNRKRFNKDGTCKECKKYWYGIEQWIPQKAGKWNGRSPDGHMR